MGPTKEIKSYRLDNPLQAQRLAALRDVFHLEEDGEDDNGHGQAASG